MTNRILAAAIALLFAHSAYFARRNRDMPNFGYYHDDGIYYTGAKSLATTGEYRLPSFPGAPFQTKYPPLVSAWHSIAWRIDPEYPANLRIAVWLQWIWLPLFAWVSWLLTKQWGFSEAKRWIVVGLIALNPYLLFFGTAILSELPFGTLVGACLLMLGRGRYWAAAVFAGLAFLTRTAGIVLLVSVPAVLLLEKRRADAMRFVAGFLPAVAGWIAWSKLRQVPSSDELTTYYTNYLGYHFHVFQWADAHLFLWKNLDQILLSAGAFFLPAVYDGQVAKIATQVLGVAAIVGATRLAWTKPEARQAGLFAALSTGLLSIWSFPPNERFLVPMAPAILAGMVVEASRVLEAMRLSFRHKDKSQRVAGYGLAALAAGFACFCAYTQASVRFDLMPGSMEAERDRRAELQPVYRWIRENTEAEAAFVAGYDSSLYLSTGRRAVRYLASPAGWYRDEPANQAYRAGLLGLKGFQWMLWTPFDQRNDVDAEVQKALGRELRGSPKMRVRMESGPAVVLEF